MTIDSCLPHARPLLLAVVLLLGGGCISFSSGSPFGEGAFEIPDADNDGYPDSEDCEPEDVLSNPESVEICDGVDNDCDGELDEGSVNAESYFVDADGDGFGDGEQARVDLCPEEASSGYSAYPGDCDDDDPAVNDGAEEVCDGVDNDCDRLVDEDNAADAELWLRDVDGDGFGDPHYPEVACEAPDDVYDYVPGDMKDDDTLDCDDTNAGRNPGAAEVCDDANTDEDCDDLIDNQDPGVQGQELYYRDFDGDGYGTDSSVRQSCEGGTGYSTAGGDCNDSSAAVYPGQGC